MRNDISEKRLATIDHVFEELSSNGVIKIGDLFARFDGNNHPHHRSLSRDGALIKQDFENAILRRSADGQHLTES